MRSNNAAPAHEVTIYRESEPCALYRWLQTSSIDTTSHHIAERQTYSTCGHAPEEGEDRRIADDPCLVLLKGDHAQPSAIRLGEELVADRLDGIGIGLEPLVSVAVPRGRL